MNNEDTLRPEYPADLIKSGVRGKYARLYREGTNIVLIDADLYKLFRIQNLSTALYANLPKSIKCRLFKIYYAPSKTVKAQ